jgi:hypothetical protein
MLSLCALLAAGVAGALIAPATLWALFSGVIVGPEMHPRGYNWKLAMLFACPPMLIVTTVSGLRSFFRNVSAWYLAFTFLPVSLSATILAVDLGYVRFENLAL